MDGHSAPATPKSERLARLRAAAAALPLLPGVYIMRDKRGRVIYVGKSRALRARVSQYFVEGHHPPKTKRMVSLVDSFDTIVCTTEMEALTLEASLIKRHSPKYNVKLKDAKNYPYIKVTVGEKYPRLIITRRRGAERPSEARYFGPYSSAAAARDIVSSVSQIFGLPICKHEFPRDIGRVRPCVYYQMGRCRGVCRGDVSDDEYAAAISAALTVLRGNIGEAKASLEAKMMEAAEEENFEAAARYRDSISALERLRGRQHVVAAPDEEKDVIAYYADADGICSCAALICVRDGAVADKETFEFGAEQLIDENGISGEGGLSGFIISLYENREYIPAEILLSFNLDESENALVSEYLTGLAGRRVTVRTPQRGDAKHLCEIALNNAKEAAELYKKRARSDERMLSDLASMLSLEVLPERIEAFDVSNLGSEHITAGMIVAVGGKLKKSEYRMFKIEGSSAPDDYAAMAEAVIRRMGHPEWGEPDLILLDGGAGHVGVVRRALSARGIDVPVFGMVKDIHHRTREIVDEEGVAGIAKNQSVFQFVYKLQEEVHRFTVAGMSKSKRKTLVKSSLTAVDGIGPAKAKALLAHFGTMTALRAASEEEIAAVRGISAKNASDVYAFLHKNDSNRKSDT